MHLSDVYHLHDRIDMLVGCGYKKGTTLFGFGYDFRQSNRIDKSMDTLKVKLEIAYKASRGSKVNIISHSMGGLLVPCFISLHRDVRIFVHKPHSIVMVFVVAVLAIFLLVPRNLSNRAYRLSLMGTACSNLYSLYSLYGKPNSWNLQVVQVWFQSVIATKDFIYFIYCLTFVTSQISLKFALLPILCRAPLNMLLIFLKWLMPKLKLSEELRWNILSFDTRDNLIIYLESATCHPNCRTKTY